MSNWTSRLADLSYRIEALYVELSRVRVPKELLNAKKRSLDLLLTSFESMSEARHVIGQIKAASSDEIEVVSEADSTEGRP